MENKLPSEFNLIIVGTGMIESILSAAASRIGKTVLHIDSDDYYGGQWASFNLKAIHEFHCKNNKKVEEINADTNFLHLNNNIFNIKDVRTEWHIPESVDSVHNKDETSGKTEDFNENHDIPNECVESDKTIPSENIVHLTQNDILKESRKFNIDLAPKLQFARGGFVELLISSNIARYVEYRSVSRVLTWLNGSLEIVPCSRSDVFANNKVSVIEKRMLMKLLTSLDEESEELKGYKDKSFVQFLKDKKLTPNLIHFVLYSISRSDDDTTCLEGIKGTKRFLNSLGRFGKTPFLFSMYGSGETTQAFCRLSAVFGGVFALNQTSLSGLKLEGSRVKSLINGDQEIKADYFVLSAEKAPEKLVELVEVKKYISRAVFITDKSVMAGEQEHLSLLMYPPENGKKLITVIEMGSLTGTCPKNYFLVHFTSEQDTNPREDFKHVVDNLFQNSSGEETNEKPKILWSLYFSLPNCHDVGLDKSLPENVYLCGGPDLDLDYDSSIANAKEIFQKMYPDLEFLPRAPDPEEIIIGNEDEQNTENNFIFKEETCESKTNENSAEN